MSDPTPIPPPELTISGLHTPDEHILSRRLVKIVPREQNQFGQQSTTDVFSGVSLSDRTTFYISDSRAFLDGTNSFITGEFEAKILTNGDAYLPGHLDEGGIHSCIRSIVLKTGSAVIERIEDYSKLYNLVKFATLGCEHTDTVEMMALDGCGDYLETIPHINSDLGAVDQVQTLTSTSIEVSAAGVITLTGGSALTEVVLGDQVNIEAVVAGDNFSYTGIVTDIASDTQITLSPNPPAAVADSANNVATKIDPAGSEVQYSMRAVAVGGISRANSANKLRFVMKPMLKFLQSHKYIPLWLLNSPLELEIEWNPARLCLINKGTNTSNDKFGYRVQRLRYVASYVETDRDTYSDYRKVYEDGMLQYPYQTWRRHNNQLASDETTAQLTFQAKVNSARMVVSAICNQADTETDVSAANAVKSQSTFEKSGLTDFRYSSGSLRFPDYGVVLCDDFLGAEAFANMQIAYNHHMNTLHNTSSTYTGWAEGTYRDPAEPDSNVDITYDSKKWQMAVNLSSHSGFMTGIDLSSNVLQLDINKAAESAAKNVKTFIYFDSVFEMSRSNDVLVKQ